MENQNNNINTNVVVKPRKIGRITLGITLILFGICVIAQMFVKYEVLRYVLMLWPLILVSFGIETLFNSNRKNSDTKFDGVAIVLTFVILFFGTIFSFVNIGINKIFYDNEFKQSIIQGNLTDNRTYAYDSDTVKVINLTDRTVKVKPQIYNETEMTRVNVKAKYDSQKVGSNLIVALRNTHSLSDIIDLYSVDNTVTIIDYPEYVSEIVVVVTIADKAKIQIEGNVVIE